MIEYSGEDNEENVAHVYRYDDKGRILSSSYKASYTAPSVLEIGSVYLTYHYNADDSIDYVDFGTSDFTGTESFELDYFDRLSSKTYEFFAEDTGTQYSIFDNEVNYTYVSDDQDTNAQVATYSSTINGVTTTYTYTYDNKGNITKIQYSNGQEIRYHYDDIGQLVREDNTLLNATYVYNYDNAGNITSKKTYVLTAENSTPSTLSSTKSCTYGNTNWKDLLTAYNGVSLTYDTIGNPLSYYNETSYTFSWNGRRLVSATTGSNSLSFTYNADGIRTSKTKNGVTTTYYLSGSQILAEETNGNFTVYIYDADGSILGFQYRGADYFQNTWDTYFFEKNLQGDIVAVYNEAGTKLVSYTYDAWGNFTRTYTNGGQNTAAANNPFTYRGYYYDFDLKFYYLNSRYYDPYIGRFINADEAFIITATPYGLTDKNLFAYCDNNPVMRTDNGGQFWGTAFDVVSLALSIYDVADNPSDVWAWIGLVGDVVDLLPIVSGVGEATDLIRATTKVDEVVDAADNLNDARKATDRTLKAIKKAAKKLDEGDHYVYIARGSNGIIEYVGITNDFARRKAEWAAKGRKIEQYINGLDRNSVRIVEQTVIETFGMAKNGGRLTNKINSISTKNPLYDAVKSFKKLIK